jgi:folate-binding protein YgfZ
MIAVTRYDIDADIVTVTGPDATSFLQSLLSQDLDPVAVGASVPTLLLQPQGKMVATMHALRVGDDEWWLIADPGAGAALAEGLNRFKIRVKADIAEATDHYAVVALRGPDAREAAAEAVVAAPGAYAVDLGWPGEHAVDVVGPSDVVERARRHLSEAGIEPESPAGYELARISAGVPKLGIDIDSSTIPQEAFLDERAVSFTKGCFVGQELVCRIDTRGHVNRYLRKVTLGGVGVPVGAELVVGDKVVGSLTSIAGDRALAMVRREVEPPAEVIARWPGHEVAAHVDAI